ncbi:hypothetical protein ACQKWADRAFT_296429 [Trichoderma austrokoningii]
MEATNTKPTEEELAKELRNFKGRRSLRPNLWTLTDLKNDFKRLRGKDYSKVASMAANTGKAVIQSVLQPHSLASNLLDKAKDFLTDKGKESVAGRIVDISLQPVTEEESKATKEFVTELGTTIIMGVFVGHVPALAAGALFTIIIYLYKSEKERQKKADDKLAADLWEKWEKTREKSQDKVDKMNKKEIEQYLLSAWANDAFDEGTVLKYHHDQRGLQNVRARDCVNLLDVVGSKGPYNFPSQFDAAKAYSVFAIVPGEESKLSTGMRAEVGKWLYEEAKAENERKATVARRLEAGENFDEFDIDEGYN